MAVLRAISGLAMALFAGAYYLIGMLFITGDTSNPAFNAAFGVFGMLGICAPVVLCGIHLMFFGGARPVWSRAVMVAALVLALAASVAAMLPHLMSTPPHPEADNVILGGLIMTGLFGWPLVAGLAHALLGGRN